MDDGNDCECDDTYLSPSEFALCAAESTCRLDCQRQGYDILIERRHSHVKPSV